jgi:signal transduction histidine kinase/DNA-binding response OmpR family regulator
MSTYNPQMTWLNYLITATLGVAFSLILVFITWNNAIDSKAREFELASSSIKDTVARNVQTANDTLNGLSSFLEVNPGLGEQQYSSITSSLLGLHPFMESAVYITRMVDNYQTERPFLIRYYNSRSSSVELAERELLNDDAYTNAINILFESDSVITLASDFTSNGWKAYWILRAVEPPPYHPQIQDQFGFIAILINTNKLVGSNINDTDLSIMLLSDSASLSGRQLLFQTNESASNAWYAGSFIEDGITQFPFYSVKLSITKNVLWKELDKTMLFISMLIGAGITLLLIALVKSKDEQEQQLRERNTVIEAKVLAQTEELAKARDQALEASLMKSSFLASMSHEIRTPLNAIIGMSDLLTETKLDFEQKKYVTVFKKAGDTLLGLVNDILDLSKIEANQLQLEEIEFNLVDTVEESVEIYALKAAEKSIELICDIDPVIQPIRTGDPSRLRQVLLNLISNALKFTDHGEIVVSIRSSQSGGKQTLVFCVKDSGTGIPEDKLEKIFESFSQADSSTTRKYGGTGLGLTISRRLIEMMGGRIWVDSELDIGSRFYIEVGFPAIDGHRENVPAKAGPEHPDVLIVDDNQHYREVLSSYLTVIGVNVTAVESSDHAMNYLNNKENLANIRLALVDAEMPDKDGFSLIKVLQQTGISIPVIMMLNPATLNQNQKQLDELGVKQMYLTKPIKMKELSRLAGSVLFGVDQKNYGENIADNNEDLRPLRILLVDDNPDNRLLVKAYLKKLPYDLDEAENGEEALSMFTQSAYDVVLMDVQMPIMDGREATRRIRQWEKQESRGSTPIIALTAHAIKEEIDLCFEAGCDTHLSKPVKKQTLISTVQDITG